MDVVVGAGWSGLAAASWLQDRGRDVVVLEAGEVGGRVRTTGQAGYLVEHGPHAVHATPIVRDLMDRSGLLFDEAPPRAPRMIVHRGRVHRLPMTPPAVLKSPLLRPAQKARLAMEPFVPAHRHDVAVARLLEDRFGSGVRAAADAFVTGVHAGDPALVSTRHAFPALWRMDQNGGVLRATRRRSPPMSVVAPREGMQAWMEALARHLDVRTHAPVEKVTLGEGATVTTHVETWEADRLILAVDPAASRRLLGLPAAAPATASVSVVAVSVAQECGPQEGYGVLAPEREGLWTLGCLFESCLFPGRAPEGRSLLRVFVGGRRRPERAVADDAQMAQRVVEEVDALGLTAGARAERVLRTRGIPQIEVGHQAWLDALPRQAEVIGVGHRAVGLAALAAEAHTLTHAP